MIDVNKRYSSFDYWLNGQVADVKKLTREEYQSFYHQWYHSVNVSKVSNL